MLGGGGGGGRNLASERLLDTQSCFVTGRKQTLPLSKHASLLGRFRTAGGTRGPLKVMVGRGRARRCARARTFRVESLIRSSGTCGTAPWRFELI